MNLTEAIIAMSIRLLKGFMIVILLVIKAFLCVIKIGLLLIGFIIKIFVYLFLIYLNKSTAISAAKYFKFQKKDVDNSIILCYSWLANDKDYQNHIMEEI